MPDRIRQAHEEGRALWRKFEAAEEATSATGPTALAAKAGAFSVATSSVSGKRAASELTHLFFPACARACSAVEYFGVCECEAICPQKFNLFDGTPKKQNAEVSRRA